jgi:NAD(P)-dependent dehydrogenase (short-subunit alcohol dehydrogenase family)
MERLRNKAIVVTGGAVGIGAACCRLLALEGASVAICDVDEAAGEALAERIRSEGGQAVFWQLDVSVEHAVATVLPASAQRFGALHGLVNNAGIAGPNKPTHELSEAEWDRVQAVNVKGVFFCTKHAVQLLRAAGGGSIVNLSSIYGLVGGPDVPPYHASKGAVRLMTKTDALLYAPDRIRVNSVHPGFIWTPMVQKHLQGMPDPDAARTATAALHPLGHLGEPEDVAWACVYLLSDESKFVTGTELVVDGGYTCR